MKVHAAAATGGLLLGLGYGCLPIGSYACASDDNCVRGPAMGVCSEGFCAYPDDECESGLRYDDLAEGELANACVEGPGADDTGAGTGGTDGGSDGSGDGGSGESGGSDETGGDCTPDPCEDWDGDGYCAGPGAPVPDCDDTNPFRFEGCLYISPGGDDAADGTTPETAWKTFAHATLQLQPGDSLVLVDGVYDLGTTGLLDVTCGLGMATVGTASAPISVTAQNERQARIVSNGLLPAARITACSYWRLSGLHLSSTDAIHDTAMGADGVYVGRVVGSDHITARRLLVSHPNRYIQTSLFRVEETFDVLLEDIEAAFYNHNAITISGGTDVTLRRVYANSRGYPDLEGCEAAPLTPDIPRCTANGFAGGTAITVSAEKALVENCATRTNASAGYSLSGTIRLLGSLSSNDGTGVSVTSLPDGVIENVIVARPLTYGVNMVNTTEGVARATLRNITVVRSEANGFRNQSGTAGCINRPDGCATTAVNIASLRNVGYGLATLGPGEDLWKVTHSVLSGNTPDTLPEEPVDDTKGSVRRSSIEDPVGVGVDENECVVYIPEDSTLFGAGEDGANIGATVLYQYQDGEPTDVPVWDPMTGQFACGALVGGVNDDEFESCIGLHQWFNVGVAGCELPDLPTCP